MTSIPKPKGLPQATAVDWLEFCGNALLAMKMPSPSGQERFRVTTGMENGQQPDLRRADDVEKAVRKTIQIQTPHIAKTDGIQVRIATKRPVVGKKIRREFQP
jgi:hypothetical protein